MKENRPESISYESYIQELQKMRDADQAMRKRAQENNWVIESEEDSELDFIHTKRMKEIVENIKNLDKRREEMGLEPFEEYKKAFFKKYENEK